MRGFARSTRLRAAQSWKAPSSIRRSVDGRDTVTSFFAPQKASEMSSTPSGTSTCVRPAPENALAPNVRSVAGRETEASFTA